METGKGRWLHSDRVVILLFTLPALIPIVVFWIYPMLETIRISTTDWDYMSPKYHYVGLDNYLQLICDPDFHNALFNTLYFCAATSVSAILLGLFLACLVSGLKRGAGFFRSVFFLPWITPTIAVSIVWVWVFNPETGLMNFLLSLVGIPKLPWIESSQWAMPAVIILSVWRISVTIWSFFSPPCTEFQSSCTKRQISMVRPILINSCILHFLIFRPRRFLLSL